jgi:hypothetical protein
MEWRDVGLMVLGALWVFGLQVFWAWSVSMIEKYKRGTR